MRKMSWKVAITMEPHGECKYEDVLMNLRHLGFQAQYVPDLTRKPGDVIDRLRGFDVALAGGDPFNAEVLEALKGSLKMIARFGVGTDKIDLAKATALGIPVTNTPGMLSGQVADMAVALLFSLSRGVTRFDSRLRTGEWWLNYVGPEIEGKTIGLIGFGQISQKFVKYLRGFDCKFLAFDVVWNAQAAEKLGVQRVSLDEIAALSDVVSLHVPLTGDTRNMIDKSFFRKMKKTAFLINTSRGEVVNEEDMIEALVNGDIAGAGLDVFSGEPPDMNGPLFRLDNVVLTPHISSHTVEGVKRVGEVAVRCIHEFYSGKVPSNIVNPEYSKFEKRRL